MKSLWKAASIAAISLAVCTSAIAQSPAPKHSGLLGLFKQRKPLFAGNIIGNKHTHVYHLPGDPGALPAPQNRVYFHTQAQAMAAGYHHMGSQGGSMGHHHNMMMAPHHSLMHM